MCKILPTTFKGSIKAWYNNLEPGLVASFSDLYAKLVAYFSQMSSTELCEIIQAKDESTRTYLKRFNEEMLKVEDLIKLVASEALYQLGEGKLVEGVVCFTTR